MFDVHKFLNMFDMCYFYLDLQICRALAYIHNAVDVCHRDIKPQNLLVKRISLSLVLSFSENIIGTKETSFIYLSFFTCYVTMQVNPQTHQLKLCDFGSAKVLVSSLVFLVFC